MRVLAFDLETVPCLVMGQRVYGVDPDAPDAYARVEQERAIETEARSLFLKPFMHRIVGLGLVGLNLDTAEVRIEALAGEREAQMIAGFHEWLGNAPVLVSWNGLGFDLPVLRYRAMYHGTPLPQLYGPRSAKSWEKYDYRFGDLHYDLCDVLSGYGRSPALKLSEAAALCEVPAKTEGRGEGVLGLWRAGQHAQIKAYVEEDARVTARVFLRWWASTGRIVPEAMERLDEQLFGVGAAVAA